jgi:hypothetical protein
MADFDLNELGREAARYFEGLQGRIRAVVEELERRGGASDFGPGPKTAAITGFGYWVFGYALPNFGYSAMGLFPTRLLVIGTIVGLVELLAASLCGAWLYKE